MSENSSKSLPCQSCKKSLSFIKYGHKIGKNGKPAKWPIYEKCKNPECKTGRKNLGIVLPPPDYEPLQAPTDFLQGRLYQTPIDPKRDFVEEMLSEWVSLATGGILVKRPASNPARIGLAQKELDHVVEWLGRDKSGLGYAWTYKEVEYNIKFEFVPQLTSGCNYYWVLA